MQCLNGDDIRLDLNGSCGLIIAMTMDMMPLATTRDPLGLLLYDEEEAVLILASHHRQDLLLHDGVRSYPHFLKSLQRRIEVWTAGSLACGILAKDAINTLCLLYLKTTIVRDVNNLPCFINQREDGCTKVGEELIPRTFCKIGRETDS
jgi:hypothetical protein